MDFQGKGTPLNDQGMDEICQALGVSEAEVWAVLTVETRGFGFLPDRRPQILFERHIFHRLTGGQFDHDFPAISSASPGGYAGGSNEFERLDKAMHLDSQAAMKSTSWGIGQVMGFNYEVAGYPAVEEMVNAMVRDENAQLMAMAKFITGNHLAGALQRQNWASFARGYNGRDYKRNEYDTRLAAAYARAQALLPDLSLRTAPVALHYLGYNPGPIDGLRGRLTRAALVSYQQAVNEPATGELDEATELKLISEVFCQPS